MFGLTVNLPSPAISSIRFPHVLRAPVQLLVFHDAAGSVPLFDSMQSGCYPFALALLRDQESARESSSSYSPNDGYAYANINANDSSGSIPPEVVRLNESPPGRCPDFGITDPFSNRVMRPGRSSYVGSDQIVRPTWRLQRSPLPSRFLRR